MEAFPTDLRLAAVPSKGEVTAALERAVASPSFRGSSQLVAFLRFVVTETVEGRQSGLKAYTIAVDGLGRPTSYDPQADSGVRVLAGRLRRALQVYHETDGLDAPVVIELPRGSYVPTFRFRAAGEATAPVAPPPASAEVERAVPEETLPPPPVRPAETARPTPLSRVGPWGVGLGLAAAVCVIAVFAMSHLVGSTQTAPRPYDGLLWPTLVVLPFEGGGRPVDGVLDVERFRSRLTDAIARFDSVAVIAAAPGETYPKAEYRISGTAETRADGRGVMRVRLVDAADGTVVLSRDLVGARRTGENDEEEERGLRKFAALVADPFGAVWSRDAAFHADERGPVRGCIIKTMQYWRTFNMAQHETVRSCLLSVLREHPGLTSIHASLVLVYYRDHIMDIVPPDGIPALDAALAVARRAVALRPYGARPHESLCSVLFARNEVPAAIRACERAIAINPHDVTIIGSFGTRLVLAGQIERGRAVLATMEPQEPHLPWTEFGLFVLEYLAGDVEKAARHANLMPDKRYPPGLLARALIASRHGDAVAARDMMKRLEDISPQWRTEPSRQLAKYFPDPAMHARILTDLRLAVRDCGKRERAADGSGGPANDEPC